MVVSVVVVTIIVAVVVAKRARIMANEFGTEPLAPEEGLMNAAHESRALSLRALNPLLTPPQKDAG